MTWTAASLGYVRLGLVVLCAGLTVLVTGCSSPPAERVDETADLIPADASMAVVVSDLDALARRLDITAVRERHASLFDRAGTALRNAVGFDILDPDSARAQGLDPARPIAFAVLSEPRGATLLALPGDPERLIERLDGVYRRRGASPQLVETHEGVPIHVADRASAAYLSIAGHVVVISGISRPDVRLALCRRVVDDAGVRALSGSETFRIVSERLQSGADLFWYIAPTDTTTDAPEALQATTSGLNLAPLLSFARMDGPHLGAGVAARVTDKRLSIASFTRLDAPAETLAAKPPSERAPDPFLERLASEPLLAVQMNVDPERLWSKLEALRANGAPRDTADGSAGRSAARMETARGRILDTLTGRVGLLANRVGIFGTDIVVYAQGNDGGAMSAALDSVVLDLKADAINLPMLGSTRGIENDVEAGVPFYRLPLMPFAEICAGVVSGHVVVTTTRDRMARIIQGSSSFLTHMPDAAIRRALTEGHVTAAYVDVAGFSKALGTLPIPQVEEYRNLMDVIDMFDHVTAVGDVDGVGYSTEITVVADEPGVWPRLIEALLAARGRTS